MRKLNVDFNQTGIEFHSGNFTTPNATALAGMNSYIREPGVAKMGVTEGSVLKNYRLHEAELTTSIGDFILTLEDQQKSMIFPQRLRQIVAKIDQGVFFPLVSW